jgi:hypothetical protein
MLHPAELIRLAATMMRQMLGGMLGGDVVATVRQ